MKLYNKSGGRVISYWNAEDKLDAKGKPVAPLVKFQFEPHQSLEVPSTLGKYLLKEWPKKFTADQKAAAAEEVLRKKLEDQGQKIDTLEMFIQDIKSLLLKAGNTKDKKGSQAAAEELDRIMVNHGREKVAAASAEAPPPETTTESEEPAAPPPPAPSHADDGPGA